MRRRTGPRPIPFTLFYTRGRTSRLGNVGKGRGRLGKLHCKGGSQGEKTSFFKKKKTSERFRTCGQVPRRFFSLYQRLAGDAGRGVAESESGEGPGRGGASLIRANGREKYILRKKTTE